MCRKWKKKKKKRNPAFLVCRREIFALVVMVMPCGRTPDYLVGLRYACAQRGPLKHSNTLTNGQYGAFKKWSSHVQTSTPTVTRVSRCSGPRNLEMIYEFVEKGQHLSSQIGKPALHLETLLSPQLTLCIMFASF